MSMNHFSSELPEAHWWSHYTMDHSSPAKTSSPHHYSFLSPHHPAAAPIFCNQNSALSFDLNNEDDDDEHATSHDTPPESENEIPKDRLFEKPLTPSDVGIPKQHAEKHFPLNGGADSGKNGLLLGFEDEVGKSWRFRYSYWNSSQSYVLTKGWSRFVKEKRLDAGDIVVFARHRVDTGRFFIGWRRRNSGSGQDMSGGSQPAGDWSRMVYSGQPYQIQQVGKGERDGEEDEERERVKKTKGESESEEDEERDEEREREKACIRRMGEWAGCTKPVAIKHPFTYPNLSWLE